MKESVEITLHPRGIRFTVPHSSPLQDHLFAHGVEFPCGGHGRCKGCRVRVLDGSLPVNDEQRRMLSSEELAAGWRLSCQCRAEGPLRLELAQWEVSVLSDDAPFAFTPRKGFGVAVDIGTTTIVAQLLDMSTGTVRAVRTGLNQQARYGADVMSRISAAVTDGEHTALVRTVRKQVGKLIGELVPAGDISRDDVLNVVLVGNTVMHHLFCDINLEPLSHFPFESPSLGGRTYSPGDLGWDINPTCAVRFLPCIAGYVGSDILAGILATGIHETTQPAALIDLGTNGEIVVAAGGVLRCCSTAAGPAFEGARISMGMRAATGAISEVHAEGSAVRCHVLGNVPPRGICGSGLVDAVASCLDLSWIGPNGRVRRGESRVMLCPPVRISQTDVRELQLAKGAIAAGIHVLLEEAGIPRESLHTVFLAGAFGNYVNVTSAVRIGLLPFDADRVKPAGNTALRGAKMALFSGDHSGIASAVRHVSLHKHPHFQELYVSSMLFPASSGRTFGSPDLNT